MAVMICVFITLCVSVFGISDRRLCADEKCEEPISQGVAKHVYVPSEEGKLHVKPGESVTVYSKSAGNDESLWGVEVNGKRGYLPKDMIKEVKVHHKKPSFIVSTKPDKNLPENNVLENSAADVHVISNAFSVVDGTTIYSNTTGEVLETQPMETATFNPQNIDIQSSKTIDATSISENTLVEPNSSLILPQPTTSSAAEFSAGGDEILGGSHISMLDEVKKSTIGTSALENNEEDPSVSIENKPEEMGNIESSEDNLEDEEEEEEDEEEDEEIQDGEEDEDDEDEDEFLESEMDTHHDSDSENGKDDKNGKETNVVNEEDKNITIETSEVHLQGSSISEPEIFGDSVDHSKTLEREHVGISSDFADHGPKAHEGDRATLVKDEIPITLDEAATANSFDNSALSQQDSLNGSKYMSETKVESEGVHPDSESMVITQNAGADEKNEYSSEISSGEASSELNTNLSNDGDATPERSNAHNDLNIDTINNIQEGKRVDEKGNDLNPFPSLTKYKEKEKLEDDNIGELQGADASVSSENIAIQDVTENENVYVEHIHTTASPIETTNPLTSSSSNEYIPEQVFETGEDAKEDSVMSHSSYESQNSDMPSEEIIINNGDNTSDDVENILQKTDSEDSSLEVQGTCEIHSVGCVPETENLPKQQFSSEEAEPGWFASLMESASLGSEVLGSSSRSKEMHINSFDTLLYLVVTAITVLVFSLGYYYIEKQRRDGSLIAKINSLEKALMVSSQEKFTLKDELESAKEKISAFITSIDSGETSSVLKDELEESRNAQLELEEQVASLEKELEAATEAGLELNRMMSELLSAQHGSDTLMKSVEHLQKQLDSQQSTISTMTANLTAKNLENENLQLELKLQLEHVQNLEEQLDKINETLMNLQKEKSEIEHDFQMKNQSIESQLVEALESKSADSQRLSRELDALQDVLDETRKTLAAREGEVSVLRDCLNHAECLSNGGDSNVSIEELLNVGHLRAKMDTITKERDELQEKLQGEEDARKLLEDHMKIVSEEVSTLRIKYEEADHGKIEAQTRLEVLSNYFKEKETQLQKELGLQEAMYIQKEGDALSTTEQIKAFQEEIENYKAQNEILKKEILDQERSMKSQIAVLEKKAHENWVAARQAERRMEESKQEASQLRNRLTMSGRRLVGTIPGPDVGKPPERGNVALEHNGEMSSSPAHMGETQELPSSPLHFGLPGSPPLLPPGGQPLPPGAFPSLPLFLPPGAPGMPFPMPPPPGGLFPDDLRPPPLGRMSSPPPEPRGSFSPFEHSPPMSPPNRPYRSPPHYEDSPSRFRHQTPPTSSTPSFTGPFSPGKWDERADPPRSSFRPLHRDSPREPKGSALSSGHSSESLDKGNRHSRV